MHQLASMHQEEVKTPVTFTLLCDIYDKSIRPLFEYLLSCLHEFDQYFLSANHFFSFEKSTTDLSDFERQWKSEEVLKRHQEPTFQYRLNGLKKAGVDAFDTVVQVAIRLDQYQYGITLMNYNNHQPFVKKLYEQALTTAEMETIADIIGNQILEQIEGQIEFISRNRGHSEKSR